MRKWFRKQQKKARWIAGVTLLLLFTHSARADEPKVSLAIPYPIDRLSHFKSLEPVHRILFETSAIGLMKFTEKGTVSLGAANGFQIREEGKVWIFTLPENLQMNGGRALQANDVQASIAYLKRGATTSDGIDLSNILPVRSAHSGLQVSFELKHPDREFSKMIASIPILDSKVIEGFGEHYGIGTQFSFLGAFQVIENRAKEGIVLGAVPELYELKPHRNAKVLLRYFPSDERVLRKLTYGLVDIIPLPTKRQLAEAEDDPRFQILPSPFTKLQSDPTAWQPLSSYWGEESEETRISTEYIIVRDSFSLSPAALSRFDLANVSVTGDAPRP